MDLMICGEYLYLYSTNYLPMAKNISIKDKKKKKSKEKKDPQLLKALETFRKAMIDSDKPALESVISEKVSYGHSDGVIENKIEFIRNIHSGKYSFISFDIKDPQISFHGKTAVVRHTLDAETNDNNLPGRVNLFILLIWKKEKGNWQLIARQAVKNKIEEHFEQYPQHN